MSVSSLKRFMDGDVSVKPLAQRFLHDFLRPRYPEAFTSRDGRAPAPDPLVFCAAVGGFFSNAGAHTVCDAAALASAMPGRYVMYRPNWAEGHLLARRYQSFRASLLEAEAHPDGVTLTETQDFPDERPHFRQRDMGAVFFYGLHVYFLMREVAESCVKFGLVENAWPPLTSGQETQRFQGRVFGASFQGIFPNAKFFCRRLGDGEEGGFGVLDAARVVDKEALGWLRAE